MIGQRDFETKLFYQLSLDRLVPQDHLLWRIALTSDFAFVRPLCRPLNLTVVQKGSQLCA